MDFRIRLIAESLRLAIWLGIAEFILLALAALHLIPPGKSWILKLVFTLGAAVVVVFGVVFTESVNHYGGFGFDSWIFILMSILAVETGILGFLSFRSPFRFLLLIYSVIGVLTITHLIL